MKPPKKRQAAHGAQHRSSYEKAENKNMPELKAPAFILILIVFTFSGSFRLFLASYTGLFVMFSFSYLLLDTSLSAISLKSSESGIDGFSFFNNYV